MLKLNRSLLLLVVAFLAACGSQAELPNAVPADQATIGEINATELENAFAALSTEGSWDKKKFNKFILEKKVYGPGPADQKYKAAIVCKVPYKPHLLAVVGAAYLKGGQHAYFYVPKKYTLCAAIELETFGDEVSFEFQNNWKKDSSGVKYYGKIYIWHKQLKFKGSKFFYVKPGEARFVVINTYEEPKVTNITLTKVVDFPNAGDDIDAVKHFLDKKHAKFYIRLKCSEGLVAEYAFKGSAPYAFELYYYTASEAALKTDPQTKTGVLGIASHQASTDKDLHDCRVTEIEAPKSIKGNVDIQIALNGTTLSSDDLANDGYTDTFESRELFDVPAGSTLVVKIKDTITNYPKSKHDY